MSRGSRRSSLSLDLVLLTPVQGELGVLLVRQDEVRAKDRWALPHAELDPELPLDESALTLARRTSGEEPAWHEQLGAFGDGRRHPSNAALTIGWVGLLPMHAGAVDDAISIHPLEDLPPLAPRQRAVVDAAAAHLRLRLDLAPIAFRLLPPTFTLTELQQMYELLLGRRLHKASFRRALQAAFLVEPTDEWRSEGRGRPAQLFRYAPRKRRGQRRGVRFDLL